VQSFQPREAELLAHETRLARHMRAARIKHKAKGAELEKALEKAREACEEHLIRVDAMQAQLPMQSNLASLQGAEGRAKAATATFKAACATWQRKLAVLASEEPSRVIHGHHELVRACGQATFRLGGDYNPAECALVEGALAPEVAAAEADQAAREALCDAVADEQAKAIGRYGRFAERYATCLKQLCMREGLGQKFGAPRRNAQERLRSAVARSESSATAIDEALAELAKLVEIGADPEQAAALRAKVERAKGKRGRKARAFLSLRVRRVLLLLRTDTYRRARFLSYLKAAPPEDGSDDRNPAEGGGAAAAAAAAGSEGAAEADGEGGAAAAQGEGDDGFPGYPSGPPPAFFGGRLPVLPEEEAGKPVAADHEAALLPNDPGDPAVEEELSTATFAVVLADLERSCRAETRALYAKEGKEHLRALGPGPMGVPKALATFLAEQHARALVVQEAWCRKLREQVAALEELLSRAPATLLQDVAVRAAERSAAERAAVDDALRQRRSEWSSRKATHEAQLRPELSSANNAEELEQLAAAETGRVAEVVAGVTETKATLLKLLEGGAADFEARLRASVRAVGALLDTMPRVTDLGAWQRLLRPAAPCCACCAAPAVLRLPAFHRSLARSLADPLPPPPICPPCRHRRRRRLAPR